jgi:hypothetical protein
MKPLILLAAIVFLSCNKHTQTTEPAFKTLSQDTVIALLIEMHLLEASSLQVALTDSLVGPKAYQGYLEIFSKYNTTKDEFEKAIDYFSHNQPQMEAIMQAVVDSLTLRNTGR